MGIGFITCGTRTNKEEIKEWSELKHLRIIFLGTVLTFFMGFISTCIQTSDKLQILLLQLY